jgi:poly-gamma-glutamate synthesis protein (capsule biosynthesis protein)
VGALSFFKGLSPICVMNVANNHFGQHGVESAQYTVQKLEAAGIRVAGKDHTPCVVRDFKKTVKIWGVSTVEDPTNDHNCYAHCSLSNLAEFLSLPECKPDDEYWILSVHWGEEYMTLPTHEQRAVAEDLAGMGFDVILGHHPHVVQPIEQIKSCTVFFSQGNFLFDQDFSGLTQRGLLSVISCRMEPTIKLFKTRQAKFLIVAAENWSKIGLSKFCNRNYSQLNPLRMRIFMKLELIRSFSKVPPVVWCLFGTRLIKRLGKLSICSRIFK